MTVEAHKRKKKPRVGIPDHLPREEITYDLPEEAKVCPHDGTPLKQIDIIPAQIKVRVHKRLKYADALPLYRQTELFKHIGIEID